MESNNLINNLKEYFSDIIDPQTVAEQLEDICWQYAVDAVEGREVCGKKRAVDNIWMLKCLIGILQGRPIH